MLFFVTFFTSAQDVIYKNDKKEIKSKIIEVLDNEIKYKKFEFLDGPTYSMPKTDIYMIIYKNGQKEMFENKTTVAKEEVQETKAASTERKSIANNTTNETDPTKKQNENKDSSKFAMNSGEFNGVLDIGTIINNLSDYIIPPIVITGDVFSSKNIGYQIYGLTSLSSFEGGAVKIDVSNISFGARANYFFNTLLKLDPEKVHFFAGATVGYAMIETSTSSSSPFIKNSSTSSGDIFYFVQLGSRYFFSKRFGIKGELQLAEGGTNIMFGLSYKIAKKKKFFMVCVSLKPLSNGKRKAVFKTKRTIISSKFELLTRKLAHFNHYFFVITSGILYFFSQFVQLFDISQIFKSAGCHLIFD